MQVIAGLMRQPVFELRTIQVRVIHIAQLVAGCDAILHVFVGYFGTIVEEADCRNDVREFLRRYPAPPGRNLCIWLYALPGTKNIRNREVSSVS